MPGAKSAPQNCPSNVAGASWFRANHVFGLRRVSRLEQKAIGSRLQASRYWTMGGSAMRGILLWLIGVPIPIIILLYLFDVI
jgi:hypothetical protein